jgi:hypothetical protein
MSWGYRFNSTYKQWTLFRLQRPSLPGPVSCHRKLKKGRGKAQANHPSQLCPSPPGNKSLWKEEWYRLTINQWDVAHAIFYLESATESRNTQEVISHFPWTRLPNSMSSWVCLKLQLVSTESTQAFPGDQFGFPLSWVYGHHLASEDRSGQMWLLSHGTEGSV